MKNTVNVFLLSFIMMVAAGDAGAEWRVWTAGAERRAARGDGPGEGSVATLAAARNEWRSFQILMRADEAVEGIGLEAGNFGEGVADVRLYRQHQMEILKPTSRNKDFKPDWYPDPLIPFASPLTGKPLRGGTLKAQPYDLPADQTQGYWIDVYVKLGGLPMPFGGWRARMDGPDEPSGTLAAQWKPYIEACIAAFGPERCMFESNFPVDKISCSYKVVWNTFKRLAAACSAGEKADLFHDTAARIYRLT
jgi:hypothetical protein